MDTNPSDTPNDAFEQAHQLWFWDGRSRAAALLYEQAARAAPDDPACQFQWARVQWALGQPGGARATLDAALLRSAHIGNEAGDRLRALQRQLASDPAPLPAPLGPADLDVDRLAGRALSTAEWYALAQASILRSAYGVALFAQEHAKGRFVDIDDEKESWALVKKAESELTRLALMRRPKG